MLTEGKEEIEEREAGEFRGGDKNVGRNRWGRREMGRKGAWAEDVKHCTCGPGVGGPGGGPRGLQRRRDGEAGEAQGGAWRGEEGEILRPLETAS